MPVAQATFSVHTDRWLAKNGKWVLLGGWLFFLALYWALASDELGGVLGGDNAHYLCLARSLAEGRGYRDLFLPGEPPHTQYPFLFPLLISPLALTGRQVFYTHLFLQLTASLIPLLMAIWARREGASRLQSLLLFFIVGSIPSFYGFQLTILSENVFMFFMYAAFYLLSRLRDGGFILAKTLLFSACVLAAARTREAGLVLFAAVFIGLILEARYRRIKLGPAPLWAVYAAVFIIGYATWFARNLLVGGGGSYFQQFFAHDPYRPDLGSASLVELAQRIWLNRMTHIAHLGGFSFPAWLYRHKETAYHVGLGFFPFILAGIARQLREKNCVVEISFAGLLLMALIWNPPSEDRFSVPLLPLAGFYFLHGLDWLGQRLKVLKPLLGLFVAALLIWQTGFVLWLGGTYHRHFYYPQKPVTVEGYGTWDDPAVDLAKYDQYWRNSELSANLFADWIIIQKIAGRVTPPNAVIISSNARITWFYAQRKSDCYKFKATPEEQWNYFKEHKATHVLLTKDDNELISILKAYPNNFKLVAGIKRSRVGLFAIIKYP